MWTPGFELTALGLLSVLALVLINAYFVATEFALVAVRRSELSLWVGEGRRGASSAARAVEQLDHAIAACQLGITVASIGLGWVGERTLAALIEPLLQVLGAGSFVTIHTIGTILAFSMVTFLHVVVGELAPKALALQRPGEVVLLCARPLLLFGKAFRWVLLLLNSAGNALLRVLRVPAVTLIQRVHSAEELTLLVDEAQAAGAIRPATGRLLGNVFRSSRKSVRDVMVPRARVCAVDRKSDPETLLDRLREEGFTRLPVFDGNLDHAVGILHTKDLFHLYAKTRLVLLADAIRPALELPPDLSIGIRE